MKNREQQPTKQSMFIPLIWCSIQDCKQLSDELLWIHHRSPSYIPAVCGHHKWVFGGNFFYFPKSCVTISVTDCFLSFCLLLFILLSLLFPCQSSSSSSISVQAAKLQWSLDEKLGGSRGTRVSRPFICVCVLCVALLSGLAVGNIKITLHHDSSSSHEKSDIVIWMGKPLCSSSPTAC